MKLTHLIILAVATWRITSLLVDENGPYDIFERLRNFVGVKYDHKNEAFASSELAKQFVCVWCMSLWVACIVGWLYYIYPLLIYFLLPFALSGFSVSLDIKFVWF